MDALGNPLRLLLTGGESHDSTQGAALIADFDTKAVIEDCGYDSDSFIEAITKTEAEAVIPPRKNRKQPREYDKHMYRERHLVECFINKIKHYRRV